jgi:hypothetical protein
VKYRNPLLRLVVAALWIIAASADAQDFSLQGQGEATEIAPDTAAWLSSESDATSAERDAALGENDQVSAPAVAPKPTAASKTPSDSQAAKKKQERLKKAAASAYKGVFYDNDFRYLEAPDFHDHGLGDGLKRMPVTDHSTLDVGGQYRIRPHIENNIRGLGLTGRDDQFVLHRVRLYANWEYDGWLRVYGEYLDAASEHEDFPPRIIEVDRSDVLNGFVDVRLAECECGKLWGRVGRQELLYGSQRLISPLDWGNTRRTFDGAKLFWRGENCNIDAFWTRPVVQDPHNFDNPDSSQDLYGLWGTLNKFAQGTLDAYYLRYEENQGSPDFDFNTLGLRQEGNWCDWLWDLEGGYQFGHFGAANVHAGFCTVGLGRRLPDHPWKPTLWVYYDWASGSDNIGAGFPGGSRELGQEIDLYATWKIDNRKEIVLGYSHFFSGDWFKTNPTPGLFRGDGDFYYMHWQVNF